MKVRRAVVYSLLFYLSLLCAVVQADPLDNWTVRQQAGSPARIVYGNGRFVVFPNPGSFVTFQILVSTNGTDWQEYLAPDFAGLSDLTYGNGQFVAVYTHQNLPGPTGAYIYTSTVQSVRFVDTCKFRLEST